MRITTRVEGRIPSSNTLSQQVGRTVPLHDQKGQRIGDARLVGFVVLTDAVTLTFEVADDCGWAVRLKSGVIEDVQQVPHDQHVGLPRET